MSIISSFTRLIGAGCKQGISMFSSLTGGMVTGSSPCRGLITSAVRMSRPSINGLNSAPSSSSTILSLNTTQGHVVSSPTVHQVRHMSAREMYKPNAHKRIVKHGYKKRTSNKRGLIVLWKRFLKGRHELWK